MTPGAVLFFREEGSNMSWHSSAILIRAEDLPDDAALLDLLGFPGATEVGPIDFEQATSIGVFDALEDGLGAAVGRVRGWASIWGPMIDADSDVLAHLSRGGAAFTLMLEGASSTAGFAWYRDGALRRRWMEQGRTVLDDEGAPLPEEGEAPADREGRVLFLLGRLALPTKVLAGAPYTLYRFAE
jgi:hypothetical protein